MRDVSEATGLSEDDVAAHLKRIRGERAFSDPPRERPSALPWIAGATLLLGVGVTAWRFHVRAPDEFHPLPMSSSLPISPSTVRTPQATHLTVNFDGGQEPGGLLGFQVEAITQTSDHARGGMGQAVKALPYETVRDALALAGEETVGSALAQDGGQSAPPNARYQAMQGGAFSPRPGFAHVTMSGWAGSETGWIAVPITDASRADLRAMAERLLKDAKETQESALAPVSDPRSGIVLPPPAFSVRFAGRRLDVQRGPRISFAPIPVAAVAARLEAAIVNAAFRDRHPPIGPWRGDAAADAKIPLPDVSRVEIMEPEGIVAAGDVPTAGDEAATARAIHEIATRAAQAIEATNRRALEKSGTP